VNGSSGKNVYCSLTLFYVGGDERPLRPLRAYVGVWGNEWDTVYGEVYVYLKLVQKIPVTSIDLVFRNLR